MEKLKQTANGAKTREAGQKWLQRIKDAERLEDRWLKDADAAVKVYSGDAIAPDISSTNQGFYDFNILFSNVETMVPAIINSPPVPDIRRRFGDADLVAKDYADLIERAIRVQVDDSKLQVELEAQAQDAFLAGRGIIRLRFRADIIGEPEREEIEGLAGVEAESGGSEDVRLSEYESEGESDDSPATAGIGALQPASGEVSERLANERITFEAVSWRDYRHGPAKRWEDRQWDAFRHSMPQEDVETFQDPSMVAGQMSAEDKIAQGETDDDLIVWEIWCRKSRKVKFIAEQTGVILKVIDDPLGLSGFFPIATPVQPVELTGRLMPVNPFAVYKKLADELDDITKRINILVRAMQVKGWYAGDAKDLENVANLEDNDFAPITNAELWAAHGGLEGAIAFWPIEKFVAAVRELYVAREQTKQAIYEITGISDIVRGASKSSETATAQQIKTQWGSLRIQKAQRAMERSARDLFVMMSEIIPAKFSLETLQKMTGIELVVSPQLQIQAENDEAAQQKVQHIMALQQMMQQPVTAFYRVDVESDSTIRADLTRQKQEVAEFLQGSGAYFSAVGPLVKEGVLPADMALEIYASNARLFNLGKSTEDAIENMVQMAKQAAKQPQQPDPEAIKAQAEAQAKTQDMRIKQMQAKLDQQQAEFDFTAKQQELEGKMALEMAKSAAAGQKAQADAAIAVMGQQLKALELEIKQVELQIKQEDLRIKQTQPEPKKEAA